MISAETENKAPILITNDDGIQALGILTVARLMSHLRRVIVVAPDSARSGAGCSITSTRPVEFAAWKGKASPEADELLPEAGPYPIDYFTCSGTPVDCIKIADEYVLNGAPALLVSGINHGDNASCSLHYSGTMGAVIEGTLKGWPSVGFSLRTTNHLANFKPHHDAILRIARFVLDNGMKQGEALNVNFPEVDELKGIKATRMARGKWEQEWADAHNPHGKRAYWLTGCFTNLEPEADDTDYWALDHGYCSVTPFQLDLTAHETLKKLTHSGLIS
ncbi:MAG: 5'/3'-nucleotidase SurE [Bacteroidales bacterium]|nr:5'/3'-nucleotidase SurE [Candidatus Physcousia equi]